MPGGIGFFFGLERKRRYFTLVNEKTQYTHSRYCNRSPQQAAQKCASKQFRHIKETGGNVEQEITFVIQEITRRSKRKMFAYKAKRIPCSNNMHIDSGATNFSFIIKIRRVDLYDALNTISQKTYRPNLKINDLNMNSIVNIDHCHLVIEI